MNITVITFLTLCIFISIGCARKSKKNIILIENQDGYVLQDKINHVDVVKDAINKNLTISRDNRVICVIEADFTLPEEEFWRLSKIANDPAYSGGLLIDQEMDGLPDRLFLGSELKENNNKLIGELKLNTFIVDDDGTPLIRVNSVDGKIILEKY